MIGYNQKVSVMIYEKILEAFPLKQGQDKDSFITFIFFIF